MCCRCSFSKSVHPAKSGHLLDDPAKSDHLLDAFCRTCFASWSTIRRSVFCCQEHPHSLSIPSSLKMLPSAVPTALDIRQVTSPAYQHGVPCRQRLLECHPDKLLTSIPASEQSACYNLIEHIKTAKAKLTLRANVKEGPVSSGHQGGLSFFGKVWSAFKPS